MTSKAFFSATWANEIELTLNAFRCIPEAKTDYKPHPKSRTAQQLVDHITAHALDLIEAVESTVVNHRVFLAYSSVAEACEGLKEASEKFLSLLAQTSEEEWDNKIVAIYAAGHKMFDLTLRDMSYGWLFDMIHHRGQLSTYYRAMGTVPPSTYGPNAEETEAMMAQAV